MTWHEYYRLEATRALPAKMGKQAAMNGPTMVTSTPAQHNYKGVA